MTVAQLDQLVSLFRSRPNPGNDLAELRNRVPKTAAFIGDPKDAVVEKVDAGGVPSEWVSAPGVAQDRALLYFHGGGYALGSIHRRYAYEMSAAANARTLLIDYRLAPEHPFPAPVDDAAKAWRWLLKQGLDPKKMALGGDSAGGGLVISTLVNLRDQKLPLPACALAVSPWVDMEGKGASIKTRAEQDPMVREAGLLWMAGMYLNGADPKTPLAAPLYADLKGLPPVMVQVGTAEVLLDDALRIAEKLHTAGVETQLRVWPNMFHIWPVFAPHLSEGRDACVEAGAFIRAKTG